MGVDIHLFLVKDKKMVREGNIFNGRNSEWFANIQGNGDDDIYDTFPVYKYDVSDQAPDELIKKAHGDWYYGYRSIRVGDFKAWFEKHHPDKQAGWVTTYEKWRYEKQGVIPYDSKHHLDKDDIIEDWCFIEWEDPYDCSRWLYNYLIEGEIDDDADITYWFDC